jgi:hypothetical protein
VQIHELPGAYRKGKLVKKLAVKAGQFLTIQYGGPSIYGDYVRARVRHDLRTPLLRFVSSVRARKRELYLCRYEKLATFCEVCGLIGHEFEECGNRIHTEKDRKFGAWLYADPPPARDRGDPEPGPGAGGRFREPVCC